jgi:hypothetical protein
MVPAGNQGGGGGAQNIHFHGLEPWGVLPLHGFCGFYGDELVSLIPSGESQSKAN